MQAMQIAENLGNVEVVNQIIKMGNYVEPMTKYGKFEIVDNTAEDFEEKQKKKTKAGDFKLTKGNKFAMLD